MKRGYDINLLDDVIRLIAKGDQQQQLIKEYGDHELSGDWKGHRKLHILPDWLLIYYQENDLLVLTLFRTGTHSDLFNKYIPGSFYSIIFWTDVRLYSIMQPNIIFRGE